jgi:integrase
MSRPFAHALIGTFLLTGGRESEVLGLELDDVNFERGTVTFRPNEWRRLKTHGSARVVPLWPQLREILRSYLKAENPSGRLLFPSMVNGREAMLSDCRKLLDRLGKIAKHPKGSLRTRVFRHSYCAARLQTLDGGAPVSLYTVCRELGHESEDMVRRVYAHLGQARHRSEVIEYRFALEATVAQA